MRFVLASTTLLAAFATALAAPKKGGLVRDGGQSIYGGYDDVLPGTYLSTCYEPDPNCQPSDDAYDYYCDYLEVDCERPCGYESLSFDGYTLEDGTKEISVYASYYSNCITDNGFVEYYCYGSVSVPPATWTQKPKSATIKFAVTLSNCDSYAYNDYYNDIPAPSPNPLEGITVAVDATLACKTLDKSKDRCQYSYSYGGERSKSVYGSTSNNCNLENVAGLKIDGVSKPLDYASFGTFQYFDKYLSLKPKVKGPK